MDKLYISDFVPSKIKINRDTNYNEHNVESVISNVEDYNKFIFELDKHAVQLESSNISQSKHQLHIKNQEKIKDDIYSNKILNLKKDIVSSSFFKTEMKSGHSEDFDEIIKFKAEEILQKINHISEVLYIFNFS